MTVAPLSPVERRMLDRLSPRTRNSFLRARGRRQAAPEGHTAEADALAKSYTEAVGYALQYGIKVHQCGQMKPLGDLRDEIRHHERTNCIHDGLFPPPKARPAMVYCGTVAAHRQHVWTAGGRAINCPGKAYQR